VAETERQSRALLQSLILASQYSLETGALVDRLEREALAERVRLHLEQRQSDHLNVQDLIQLADTLDASGISLWTKDRLVSFPAEIAPLLSSENVLSLTAWNEQDDAIALSFEDSVSGQIWAGVGFTTTAGEMIVWNRKLAGEVSESIRGIGELIQEIGRQSGISYIMLQSPDGIVFASRPLKPVLKLAADTFLVDVLEADIPATRELVFEGIPVVEAAAPFLSTELPSGMFRVGLGLYAVDDAVDRLTLQLGLTALLLLLLSTTVAGFVVTRRSLADLGQSYREVETLTGRVLDSIDQAVVAIDAEGRITIFNPTAERLFGVDIDSVRRKSPRSTLPADFGLEEVRLTREARPEQEIVCQTPHGECVLVYSTTPLVTSDKTHIGAVAVIRDETESRAMALQVRRAERLSAMGQLAAGVAHEIRNPLNAIALASQQLKLELGGAPAAGLADTIWGESKRLNGIVDDFLSLARPSTQPKEPVDWKELVGSVAQMAAIEADKNQVALRFAPTVDCRVNGVPGELRKAVWNLLRNAIAATPVGGEIVIGLTTEGASAVLTIDDSGSGITPEALPRIFEPWFTTKSGGTGLGLAITFRIIEDHLGAIDVVSPVPDTSVGTRVRVRLPLVEVQN
jgi:PAS domain S-box-containing protein